MGNLGLHLLGPVRVKLEDEYIEVKPRKVLALLISLAVTAEHHSRDSLATLLWPDSDQRQARHSLRNAAACRSSIKQWEVIGLRLIERVSVCAQDSGWM